MSIVEISRAPARPFGVAKGFPFPAVPAKPTRDSEEGDDLAALRRIGMKLHFTRNETIFSEGDPADYSYKVVSGAIRLCKHLVDGRRQIAEFVLPGDYCGLLHLDEHHFTAEAASDLTVIAYPQRQVESLGEQMPSMRRRLTHFLSQKLRAAQDHLTVLGRQTAKERVVSLLLSIAERCDAEEGTAFNAPMSRQDMADYLGLTIETVCRTLGDLKRTGLISIPNQHQLALDNLAALQALAEGEDEGMI